MPGHGVADVVLLAALGTDDRLDVLRPPPAWREDGAPDGQLAQLDQLDTSLLDTPDLVGKVEALATQLHEPIVRIGAIFCEWGALGIANASQCSSSTLAYSALFLGGMQQMPRLLDIGMHLPDQRLFPRVFHLSPQPSVEVDRDLHVIELQIVAIQHIRLDSTFHPVESWICTDGNSSGPAW